MSEDDSKMLSIPQSEAHAIRRFFLQRQEQYALTEAAEAIGVSRSSLRREIAAGNYDATMARGRWTLSWKQLAFVAMQKWSIAAIVDALGDDASAVLPPLLLLEELTVRLPQYVIRALEIVAQRNGVSVNDALYGELIDFAGTLAGEVDARVRGYADAYFLSRRAGPWVIHMSGSIDDVTDELGGADAGQETPDELEISVFGLCDCCDQMRGPWIPLLANLDDPENLPQRDRQVIFILVHERKGDKGGLPGVLRTQCALDH